MTLENLKEFWKDVSLKHKDVQQFNVGNNYDVAEGRNDKYPLVFWEMPYTVNYNAEWSKGIDTVTIAFNVFLYTKRDDIADSHEAISIAKSIGDAIISKVRLTATEFKIQGVNALSVREYSDDYVAGMRWDLTILLQRDICDNNINEYFDEL